MKKIILTLGLLLIFQPVHCVENSIDKIEKQCLSKTFSTSGMYKCESNAWTAWFKEIDKYMVLLKKKLPIEQYNQLVISQKKWKDYQIAEFLSVNKMIHEKGGTVYIPIAAGIKRQIVKQRALDLQVYYNYVLE